VADAGVEVAADVLDGEIDHLRIELSDEHPKTRGEQNERRAAPGGKADAGRERNHGTSMTAKDLREKTCAIGASEHPMSRSSDGQCNGEWNVPTLR
jgi:hypothetical protein